jgi:chromate transporter
LQLPLWSKLARLGQIFSVFFRIGPTTFGGGYAMMNVMEREVVHKRKWMDESDISNLLSIAGTAPGGVGVNAAAFIGYRMGRMAGAVAAVLGITLPCLLILLALDLLYVHIQHFPKVIAALRGIHGAVIGLIAAAAYQMAKSSLMDKTTVILAAGSLGLLLLTGWNPIFLIMAGLVLGLTGVQIKKWLGLTILTEKEPPSDTKETGNIEYYI